MESRAILTGAHFLLGDVAIAEGAIAGGCSFFGGYPITPSTEVAERMAQRLPQIGGVYAQMEDELASMAAIIGASWGGRKAMTATSGPGFSLMMENLGLALITETPVVVCNVQRGGPSTGLPTAVAQGDMMQARWGSHGHYELIALVPWSVQECFDLTVRAFNLAERYRTPVLILADAEIGHLMERVVIPPPDELEVWQRKRPRKPPNEAWYEPAADLVPPMALAGDGYNFRRSGCANSRPEFAVSWSPRSISGKWCARSSAARPTVAASCRSRARAGRFTTRRRSSTRSFARIGGPRGDRQQPCGEAGMTLGFPRHDPWLAPPPDCPNAVAGLRRTVNRLIRDSVSGCGPAAARAVSGGAADRIRCPRL